MITQKRSLRVLLCIFPLILLVIMLRNYSTNIPFMDQWSFVPVLEKMVQNTLTFHDLWVQHNEHRIFFPKIIMLVLAKLTNWNIYFELTANIVLGVFIYLIVVRSILKTKEIINHWILCILSSFFIFSLVQWENWTWGWQIQIFLNVLSVFVSLYSFCLHKNNKNGYIITIIFGIIATFSFANGVFIWPIILLILTIDPSISIQEKSMKFLVFLSATLLNIFLFFYGYQKLGSLSSGFQPWVFIKYFFAYLGSPIGGFDGRVSIICGGLSFIAYSLIAFKILFKKRFRTDGTLFWFSTSLYPILSGILSAIGRSILGYEQALSSRYTTISNMYWISLITLIIMFEDYFKVTQLFKSKLGTKFKTVVLLIVVVLFILNSGVSYQRWVAHYNDLHPLENELLACNESNFNRALHDINWLKSSLVELNNTKLSIFSFKREKIREVSIPSSSNIDLIRGNLSETSLTKNGCLQISGWVIDAERNAPVSRVVAAINNEIIMTSSMTVERPDIIAHFNNPNLLKSGWWLEISGAFLPIGISKIDLYGVRDNKKYFKFGTVNIQVEDSETIFAPE